MRLQIERKEGRRLGSEIRFAVTLVLMFVIAQLADQWIFHHFTFHAIDERAWGRMLLAGYLPLWGIVALALVLHDRAPRGPPTLPTPSRVLSSACRAAVR